MDEFLIVVGLVLNLAGSYFLLAASGFWQQGAAGGFKGLWSIFLIFEVSAPGWLGPLCLFFGFLFQLFARF